MARLQLVQEMAPQELAPGETYRESSAKETIYVLRTHTTVSTIQAFGSDDGYTSPYTEFADDESILLRGSVRSPDNNGDLTGISVEVYVNSVLRGRAVLGGFDGSFNYYELSLGVLPIGTYVVEAVFPRTRV